MSDEAIMDRTAKLMEKVMLADPLGDGPESLKYAVVEVPRGRDYYDAHDFGDDEASLIGMMDPFEKMAVRFDDSVRVLRYRRINKTVFGHAIFELDDGDY